MKVMSMKGKLGLLTAMAIMSGGLDVMGMGEGKSDKKIDITPKVPPVPKGCQRYFFNANGGYNTELDVHTVFDCVAASFKSAQRKFNNWKSKQQSL